jgi:hypothetical protein
MLRALVILFVAMAALEIAAVALGKANLMGGLVIIGLALFFAGTLHALDGIQRDVRGLLAHLRGSAERPGGQDAPWTS